MDVESLKFARTHEWVSVEGDIATVGISAFAVQALTDLVYADLGAPPEQALAEILLSAVNSEGHQRFALFQLTGDLALFLTGFFADSVSIVDEACDGFVDVP